MQTLNISAMKLIFPMKFIDGFHKVYGSFGEYSTLISKSGYPKAGRRHKRACLGLAVYPSPPYIPCADRLILLHTNGQH